jgi:two-component system cell cycle sensor histidine kinase/response regulator CckA
MRAMTDHSHIDRAFEYAPQGMFVATLEGEFVAVNRAMRTLLKHSPERPPAALSLPALLVNPDEMLDLFQLLHDGGRFDDLSLSFRCADDSARTLRLSASVLPVGRSGLRCFLGTALVPARPAEGDPLETSRMHAVERLAAAVAHDLNNVLSAVVGYCHLLREPLRTHPQALQDLIAIEQSSDRAAAVVRQLLVFGRKRILEPEVLNVAVQLDLLEPILRRVLPAETTLVVQSVENARILIDHMAFNEILILLLSARNSMTESGDIHIQATVGSDDRLHLDITDAGSDLSAADIEKCVDELFASPESAGGYSGLGLAAVHVLVARSGGAIRVIDTPGVGTTFRLSFAILPSEAGLPTEDDRQDAGTLEATGTILLVEDDLALREIARRVLSDAGYVVVEARSGEEALAIARERDRSFDVLVTDMMMPGIKGWEVGRAVKALFPRCAMVYVSGYVDSIRLRQELPEDAVFVAKPYVPPRLLEAVAAASAIKLSEGRRRAS